MTIGLAAFTYENVDRPDVVSVAEMGFVVASTPVGGP